MALLHRMVHGSREPVVEPNGAGAGGLLCRAAAVAGSCFHLLYLRCCWAKLQAAFTAVYRTKLAAQGHAAGWLLPW